MSEVKAAVEVKQEGEFSLKGKKTKPKKLVDNTSSEPIKVDLTKPEAQGEVVPDVIKVDLTTQDTVQEVDAEPVETLTQAVTEEAAIQEITEEEVDEKTVELYEEAEQAVKDQVTQEIGRAHV